MLAHLSKAKYISEIDICNVYQPIRISDKDVWKRAICTYYGLFESLVMPFGLTNVLAIFQQYVNKTLHPYLDAFGKAYLNDILIYSWALEEPI
jgi:hypothetical protein